MTEAFGALAPGRFDRMIMAMTARLPDNRLGLRLAIALRRAVTMRLSYPDGALDVERWGMKLRLHPRDNGCEKNLLFTPQMYEPVELAALAADIAGAADRAYVFIDVGANVGLFSLFVAARARAGARIVAVEPEPGNLRRLKFNLAANPAAPIKALPVALSDQPGEVAIALDRRDRGGSRAMKIMPAETLIDTVRVPAQTLYGVLAAEGIDAVDALKIDVEGMEDVILQPFFRDAPPRLWPRLMIVEDSSPGWKVDLMAILSAKGYAIAARSRQNIVLRRLADDGAAWQAASGGAGDVAPATMAKP